MRKPRLLDLFCGAGGASMGYHRAGFEVAGVDMAAQPHYPFEFFQADALGTLKGAGALWIGDFDAIHASPPCQAFTKARVMRGRSHPDLLSPTRVLLEAWGIPWVIENVPGAPMRADYDLCGCFFNLPGLRRPRWFEVSWGPIAKTYADHLHLGHAIEVFGHGTPGRTLREGRNNTQAERQAAMGIGWMNRDELAQSIPPAFSEFVGTRLLAHVKATA